jgi:phosphohistidine phosphatase
MNLHLIRHAKTEKESDNGGDFSRGLLPRGISQCADLKKNIFKQKIKQPTVWCSSAIRTNQTWQLISDCLQPCHFENRPELYLCNKEIYLQLIWANNRTQDIVIIGHNFGISDLAEYLLDEPYQMKTSEYLCLEMEIDSWVEASKGLAVLKSHFRSESVD